MTRGAKDHRLFIISDLHLGGCDGANGRPGSRLFSSHAALADFVDWTAAQGMNGESVELVVNGDIVDFLADDPGEDGSLAAGIFTGDETEAVDKLAAIRRAAPGVFAAFGRFLAAGHRLTLLLGNHDVELSLPRVRRTLEDCLDAHGRDLNFIYDGEAYTVGRVLIEHGNRYDPWNQIDHDAMRRERSVRSRGAACLPPDKEHLQFEPPAGTLLVIHFLNRIKRTYRFVDLLKPEEAAVLPLLLALSENKYWARLDDIMAAAAVGRRRSLLRLRAPVEKGVAGNLAHEVAPSSPEAPASLAELARSLALDEILFPVPLIDRETLSGSESWSPWQKAKNAFQMGALALGSSDRDGIPFKRLHEALIRLNLTDDSFDITREKSVYLGPAREMIDTGEFQAVVFGHTHLPKLIPHRYDRGIRTRYINTGTWADVMRLPQAILDDGKAGEAAVLEFCEALRANDHSHYVQRYLAYAEIPVGDGNVRQADLRFWCGRGRERETGLTGYPR
ncbi:MAG: metallophosphoesterase [Alphaproteobacteria bacterium]|nr:metallophosphoesterase [Alphaproteobacteria bacterium]